MPPTTFLEYNASSISLIKLKVAFAMDEFAINPNCSFTSAL